RQWDCKMKIAVSIHAGRAAVGEIGSSDPPAGGAIGQAVEGADEGRKAAPAHRGPVAVSGPGYAGARLAPDSEKKLTVPCPAGDAPVAVCLSASAAGLVPGAPITARSPMPEFLRKLRA